VLGGNHEQSAADWIAPLLGTAISEPIRQHVAAKRFLVTTQPEYETGLSAASRSTLSRQGGPMTAKQCEAFRLSPWSAEALQLRYVDDSGKGLTPPEKEFLAYEPLLRVLAIRHLLGQQC
jgi:gamma-butyrobetaine dioxygenase